jgi:hypothetical protein
MFNRLSRGPMIAFAPENDEGAEFEDEAPVAETEAEDQDEDQDEDEPLDELPEEEADDEQDEPPAPQTRGQSRHQALANKARDLEAELASLRREREAETQRQQREQFQRQEEQRLAEMTPEERIEHRVNQRLAQVEFNGWNTNDQVAFQRAADRNPAVAALTEEVEAAFQAQLKAGKPTDRITIAKFLIGDKALSRAPRAKAAGKRATEAGRERQTAKPTSSRGDVAATGRRAASEAEARRKRLEDTLI